MSAVTGVGYNGRYTLRWVGCKRSLVLVANIIVLMSSIGCSDPGLRNGPERPKGGVYENPVLAGPKKYGDGGGKNSGKSRPIQIANLSSQETGFANFGLDRVDDLDEVLTYSPPIFGAPDQTINVVATPISRRDLRISLRPGKWLQDDVINAYFSVLQKTAKPRYKLVAADFWWNFNHHVSDFLFPDIDFLIFPINHGNFHWTLGAINFKAKTVLHFDSLSGALPQNFKTKMDFYLGALGSTDGWKFLHQPLGWQTNGFDCGVYTCFLAEQFSVGRAVDFESEYIPQQGLDILRRRIAAKLVEDGQVMIA